MESLKIPFDQMIFPFECLLMGRTVVIQPYNYNRKYDIFEYILIFNYDPLTKNATTLHAHDPIRANGFRVLSDNFLIFSTSSTSASGDTVYNGVHIYRRSDEHGPFILHQLLHLSDYDELFGARIGKSQDLFLVYAMENTIAFTYQNDMFQEALVLDRPCMSYQISDRNVLTTTFDRGRETFPYRIDSFSMASCVQVTPTGTPTAGGSVLRYYS